MPMIDWVTAILPCTHKDLIIGGSILCIDPNGDTEWSTEKALSVVGSYDNRIQIRTDGSLSRLWLSGNPVKFLQGHNIFGSCDLLYLISKAVDKLVSMDLGLCPTDFDLANIRQGNYQVSRVDINQSYHLANRDEVLAWLRAAESSARLRHRGSGLFAGNTLYYGKHSRYWALKCYSKILEILAKGHQLPAELQIPELLDWAEKALRIEAVIRSMELKRRGLNIASAWSEKSAKLLLQELIGHLEMTGSFSLPDEVIKTLPSHLSPVYSLWLRGADMRTEYKKPTFYRHRKALLAYGIDIAVTQESTRSNIVPLYRVLEALPAEIPQWAYDKGLVA